MGLAFLGLLCLLVIANVAVSAAVLRSPLYESRQKSLQLLLIWFLPVLGSLLAWFVLRGATGVGAITELASRDESPIGIGASVSPHMNTDAADIGGFGEGGS